jgi:hypothetical protein
MPDKKTLSVLFISLFLLILVLPMFQTFFPVVPVAEINEKREKALLPEINYSGLEEGRWMAAANNYFNDHYGFRDLLIRINQQISFYLFHVSTNPNVIIGKNDFLFIGDSINDYNKTATFTGDDIQKIVRNFKRLQEELSARGVKFLLMVPPNANSIYSESMPFERLNKNGKSNLDLLRKALSESKVNYFDMEPFLLKEKKKYLLYFKRDTHWNLTAAALVANELLKYFYHDPSEDYVTIKSFNPYQYKSDLNIALGLDPQEKTLNPVIINREAGRKLPRTVWVHDSFSWQLIPYLKPFFKEFYYYHYSEPAFYGYIASRSIGAGNFVFEITERQMYLLTNMNLDYYNYYADLGKYHCIDLKTEQCDLKENMKESANKGSMLSTSIDPQFIWLFKKGLNIKYFSFNAEYTNFPKVQVFWENPDDNEMSENRSVLLKGYPYQMEYLIDFRNKGPIKALRLDPCNQKGLEFKITSIKAYY